MWEGGGGGVGTGREKTLKKTDDVLYIVGLSYNQYVSAKTHVVCPSFTFSFEKEDTLWNMIDRSFSYFFCH